MPTYQYKCNKCHDIINAIRGINDPEQIPQCSACKIPMNRLYSLGAVTFNGSGFYSKDK
jgi:putative FmdB family regulatory protein